MDSCSVGPDDNDEHDHHTNKHLSFTQGKDIATRALKKGFAIEKLSYHILKNSVSLRYKRMFIARLKANLYGKYDSPDIYGIDSYDSISSSNFSDAQLKLLRQEQLSLMAENSKLVRLLESRATSNYTSNANNMAISQAIQGNIWGCDSLVIKDRSYVLEKIVLILDKVLLKILAKSFRQIILYAFIRDNVQDARTKLKNNAIRIRMFYACATLIQSIRSVYRRDLSMFLNCLIRSSLVTFSRPIVNPLGLISDNKRDVPTVPFPTYYKNLHSVKKFNRD